MGNITSGDSQIISESEIMDVRDTRERTKEGVKSKNKEEGGSGQPCFTPLSISIQVEVSRPKKGETLTLLRAPRTKRESHRGKPTRLRIKWIQLWSIESNALAVSKRKRRRSSWLSTPSKKKRLISKT